MACAGLGACDRQDAPANPPEAELPASLVGLWRATTPVRFAGEEVRTETSASETEYRRDGSFRYRARLAVFGEKLPDNGLSFRVQAAGVWRLQDGILSERFSTVDVTPEVSNGALKRLARALGDDLAAGAANLSDVVELDQTRLTLRDRENSQIVTYLRKPPGSQ